ncbi:hypothetical protein HAX54_008948 [Datura stramonium]|uniref:Uncharacterized protein n=1 Tax=Datura stramonium TaxID=4076 RepID=A0ABS8RVR9_DATST|nr:hypothetical protein [Datura stramonium]
MAGWSELPQDLTRLTAHWLVTSIDQVRFTCVCTSWRYSRREQCGRGSGTKSLSHRDSMRFWRTGRLFRYGIKKSSQADAISISGCRHQLSILPLISFDCPWLTYSSPSGMLLPNVKFKISSLNRPGGNTLPFPQKMTLLYYSN